MPIRLAGAMSLVVFAICLFAGIAADNPPATILERALEGMGVTLAVGLILGLMARRMLDENIKSHKSEKTAAPATPAGAPAAAPAGSRKKN